MAGPTGRRRDYRFRRPSISWRGRHEGIRSPEIKNVPFWRVPQRGAVLAQPVACPGPSKSAQEGTKAVRQGPRLPFPEAGRLLSWCQIGPDPEQRSQALTRIGTVEKGKQVGWYLPHFVGVYNGSQQMCSPVSDRPDSRMVLHVEHALMAFVKARKMHPMCVAAAWSQESVCQYAARDHMCLLCADNRALQ